MALAIHNFAIWGLGYFHEFFKEPNVEILLLEGLLAMHIKRNLNPGEKRGKTVFFNSQKLMSSIF